VSDNEVITLICYITNTFPELPRISKTLNKVVRHIVKNLPLKEIEPLVENILLNVKHLLYTWRDLMPLSTFAWFN
jgi:hypothetical protein